MKKLIALLMVLILVGCETKTGTLPESEPDSLSPVYTDWSKLTPYEPVQPIYTYHAGYNAAGALEARDDYGALLPYIGKYSTMEWYVIDALPLYGLVTSEGELVTDPVYARIDFYDDFLVLYRGDPMGISGGDTYSGGTFSRTIAAPDGHWVHELTDSYYVGSGCGLLMTAASDGSLNLWNVNGEVVTHFDAALFTSRLGDNFTWGAEGGPYIDWVDDKVGYVVSYNINGEYQGQCLRLYLDFTSGTVADTPPEGYESEINYSAIVDDTPQPPVVDGCNYLDPITDKVTGETCFYGLYRSGENENGRYCLFDSEGKLLLENVGLTRFESSVIVRAGLCSTLEDGCFCYRSLADNTLVFRYIMRTNTD